MWVSFEELAEESRVWVYQSSRPLSGEEENEITAALKSFCDGWDAHGTPLKSSFRIDRHQFLILAVDEAWSGASGCSIDGSVNSLKTIQASLAVDFFDRTKASFLINDQVVLIPLKEIKAALTSGILNPATPAFNTLAATKGQLATGWLAPFEKTWLARYLPKNVVV